MIHAKQPRFINEPFLLWPEEGQVSVVWFTSFKGKRHFVESGRVKHEANTTPLSKIRKDLGHRCQSVSVWRHEARIKNIPTGERQSYRVVSETEEKVSIISQTYSLAGAPPSDKSLKILLTSDHQRKLMVAANLEKAFETIGPLDAVFCAGDLVEYGDSYDDWFEDKRGFFPCLQAKGDGVVEGHVYRGAAILQHTPLFAAVGNHDVMGRFSMSESLESQFKNPFPKDKAKELYPESSEEELKNLSFNIDTFSEIFNLPRSYYAITFGEVRLIVLNAVRVWREAVPSRRGKYQEALEHLKQPQDWGYGDFIFESLNPGSAQYEWLKAELESPQCKDAKLKIVMLHNPIHGLGENAVPPFTDPVQSIVRNDQGEIVSVRYDYPPDSDVLVQHIEPLLEAHSVDIVFCGHSHVWNRFQTKNGMHHLESSNVGNSYGAYTNANHLIRSEVLDPHNPERYAASDDPNGLTPTLPTIAPLKDESGKESAYISSNSITVFSVLDTGAGVVDSYYFDCSHPEKGVVRFDSFCPYRNFEKLSKYAISRMVPIFNKP